MKKVLFVLPLLLAADCKKGPYQAPPITDGKCVVDTFKGPVAVKQVCVFKGYNYACTDVDCQRTGEATGELPK